MGNCMQSLACGCMRPRMTDDGSPSASSRGSSRKPLLGSSSHGRVLIEGLSEDKKGADGGGERGVLRVKVVLTKAEAALLLSKGLADSTEMILERLATELAAESATPSRSQSFGGGAWRPALESIPEVA